MENNSAMGRVVAAPTAGSCGVIPGILFGLTGLGETDEQEAAKALLCAGLVGVFIASQATFAAEVAACQAEIGAASCMGAAIVSHYLAAMSARPLQGASLALQNMLGLVCDPVAGCVDIPASIETPLPWAIPSSPPIWRMPVLMRSSPWIRPFRPCTRWGPCCPRAALHRPRRPLPHGKGTADRNGSSGKTTANQIKEVAPCPQFPSVMKKRLLAGSTGRSCWAGCSVSTAMASCSAPSASPSAWPPQNWV